MIRPKSAEGRGNAEKGSGMDQLVEMRQEPGKRSSSRLDLQL